jgi:hypothetical protein
MPWASITWVTGGLALRYLEEKNAPIHKVSYVRQDLGRCFEALFQGGVLKPSYSALRGLVIAGRLNADILKDNLNLDEYDGVVADEFWDMVVYKGIPSRSVFITDFIQFKPISSLVQHLFLPFVNRSLSKALRKFHLRLYVGLDSSVKHDGFEYYGQIFTHNSDPSQDEDGGAVISVGGTSAGTLLIEKASEVFKRLNIDYDILGPPPYYRSDPLTYIASSRLVITLGGYSTLIEVARFRKRAIITPLGRDFEQRDNARVFDGRSGYRVIPLDKVNEDTLRKYVEETLKETPNPPEFIDASGMIAARIRECIKSEIR